MKFEPLIFFKMPQRKHIEEKFNGKVMNTQHLQRETQPWEHLRQRNRLCMCGIPNLQLLLTLRLCVKNKYQQ